MTYSAFRIEELGAVHAIVFTRAEKFNTITPTFRDELAAALDAADRNPDVKVVLLRAGGARYLFTGDEFDGAEAVRWRDRPFADYAERERK
ncbi:MAG: enoyl-CoA hydratase-related protein [Parvibaculum sp.]